MSGRTVSGEQVNGEPVAGLVDSHGRTVAAWQRTVLDATYTPPRAAHRAPGQPESAVPCLLGLLGSIASIALGAWLFVLVIT